MKKENLPLLAPLFSLLALLAALVIGVLKAFQQVGLYTPSNPALLTQALQISGVVFVLGLAVYAILEPDRIRVWLTGKKARDRGNLLILTLAFLGILIILNYLAYQNPQSWDLTADQSHTLAPESIEILKALPEKVQATAFFSAYTPMNTAEQLLQDFKQNSNGKFEYQFVDPDLNPVAAREAGITGDGKILLTMGDRQEIVSNASEQELVRGMLRLLNPDERTLYFVSGHGEYDSKTQGERAATRLLSTLYGKNYTVLPLNLRAENAIPDNALALIVMGATDPFTEKEIALLDEYLAQGGGLVLLADPTPVSELPQADDTLAAYLAEKWGLHLDDDLIVDPSSTPPSDAVAYNYAAHPVTNKMNNIAAYFPFARSIHLEERDALTQTDLVTTIDRAWGETDFSALDAEGAPVAFDEESDLPGPLTIAAAVEDADAQSRLVVFGNAFFASDEAFDAYGNGDLLINAIDWVAEQEDSIQLTPKPQVERVFLAPNDLQLVTILLSAVCLLPGMMVLGGFLVWRNRKKRG